MNHEALFGLKRVLCHYHYVISYLPVFYTCIVYCQCHRHSHTIVILMLALLFHIILKINIIIIYYNWFITQPFS